MSMKFNKTRVMTSDVGRYAKVETGTANDPVAKSSRLPGTRVESGGVTEKDYKGMNAKKASTRLKKTRATK